MAYFDIANYGGLKLRNKPGYFTTPGLPEPSPTFSPTSGAKGAPTDPAITDPGATKTGAGAPPPDTGVPPPDTGVQPPVTTPPYNPYTQKQESYQTMSNSLSGFLPQLQGLQDELIATLTGQSGKDRENTLDYFYKKTLPEAYQSIRDTLASYGFELNTPSHTRWWEDFENIANYLMVTSSTGEFSGEMNINSAIAWLNSEAERLGGEAIKHDEFTGFMEGFQNWATDYEAGETQVDPFTDPNGWNEMVQSVFGDMAGLPDIQDLLEGMYHMMPVWEYTADALPNLTAPERMTKFFDDLKANGFDMEQMQGGLDQELRNWLYKMAQELQPSRMFAQLDLDMTAWNKMTNTQIAEITKMLGQKSVLDDADTRKYLQIQMRKVKQINQAEYNHHIGILAEKGIAHGGAMVRSAQELSQRLGDAEMVATADLFMRGVELAQQGKWEALSTFAQISDTQAELMLGIGGLKASLFGQYFDFLSDIGQISASEFSTKTEAHVAEATLRLKYSLGVAGLEIDKYVSDRGLDLEGLRLEYDNYWRDRGANLEEKQAEFNNAIAAWQTSAMMAEMVNSGRTERLVQMADLALKALSGDMEAHFMYTELALQERLEQRGMNIEQTLAMANLMVEYKKHGENLDFNRWATKYDATLKKELLRMGIEGEKDLLRLKDELEGDGFWGGLIKLAGGLIKLGGSLFDKDDETTDDGSGGGGGNYGGGSDWEN